jgi:hypothetical protein
VTVNSSTISCCGAINAWRCTGEKEEEDPAFLKAIQESLKDDAERKRAEEEEEAAAIAAVKEAQLREAEADSYIVDLSE